ncbi:hypothetical protein N7467_001912 [Penicillium canescens]|nr:hypothetical protein N7467_001912 [Penicillium canescens]
MDIQEIILQWGPSLASQHRYEGQGVAITVYLVDTSRCLNGNWSQQQIVFFCSSVLLLKYSTTTELAQSFGWSPGTE